MWGRTSLTLNIPVGLFLYLVAGLVYAHASEKECTQFAGNTSADEIKKKTATYLNILPLDDRLL